MKLRLSLGALLVGALATIALALPVASAFGSTRSSPAPKVCPGFTYKGARVTKVGILQNGEPGDRFRPVVTCHQAVRLLRAYYDKMTLQLYRNPPSKGHVHLPGRFKKWALAPYGNAGPGVRYGTLGWPAVVGFGPLTLGSLDTPPKGTGSSPSPAGTTPLPSPGTTSEKPADCLAQGPLTPQFSTEQLASYLVHFIDATNVPYCYSPITVHWDFGDPASNVEGPGVFDGVTHQYSGPGTYHVTLTITDVDGKQHTYASDVAVTFVDPNAPADPVSVGGGGIL